VENAVVIFGWKVVVIALCELIYQEVTIRITREVNSDRLELLAVVTENPFCSENGGNTILEVSINFCPTTQRLNLPRD